MHLWPSVRIRASFKDAHLRHLDWNLRRMHFHQSQQATAAAAGDDQGCEPLLSNKNNDLPSCRSTDLLRDTLLLLISCCCCCFFCCGACHDEDEK
ncbi:hypothetical protein Taro_028321 [Colocasia esculenta]|uniref:Uncharacterized protein n=1 Tax=Colocasia esculenta TaxID=4460 RepID=A0A843VGY8_COLES|nr:hypothetical protein [Colocasia esculenta]